MSITFGIVRDEGLVQSSVVSPVGQTPNEKALAVCVNSRAWPELNPFCPVSAAVNVQPEPTVPNADCGTIRVVVCSGCRSRTAASRATRTAYPDRRREALRLEPLAPGVRGGDRVVERRVGRAVEVLVAAGLCT